MCLYLYKCVFVESQKETEGHRQRQIDILNALSINALLSVTHDMLGCQMQLRNVVFHFSL